MGAPVCPLGCLAAIIATRYRGVILRSSTQSVPLLDVLALTGAGLAWGLTPAVTKFAGFTGIPVLAWSGLQALAAAMILGVLVGLSGRRMPRGMQGLSYCLAAGLVGLAVPNVVLFLGMRHVPAGFFSLLAPLSPVLTALLLGISGHERVGRAIVAGSLLASAGALLAMLPGAALPDRSSLPWALGLLGVPVAYAASNTVAAAFRPAGVDGMALAAGTLAAAAGLLLPIAWAAGHIAGAAGTWGAALPWVLAQGALQAFGFGCYFRLIVRQGGVFASQVAYLITLSGVLWGIALFAERPGLLTLPAALLISGGLFVLTRAR